MGGETMKTKSSPFGYRENRDQMWIVIREKQEFTINDIEDETRIIRTTIRSYLQGLVSGGYLQILNPGERKKAGNTFLPERYELINDIGVEAPQVDRKGQEVNRGARREQMWRTMKVLGQFNYKDLAINASLEDSSVSEMDAKKYCNMLYKAGFLALKKRGKPGGTLNVYLFLNSKNTGPKPPRIKQITQVWDANTDKVMYESGGAS